MFRPVGPFGFPLFYCRPNVLEMKQKWLTTVSFFPLCLLQMRSWTVRSGRWVERYPSSKWWVFLSFIVSMRDVTIPKSQFSGTKSLELSVFLNKVELFGVFFVWRSSNLLLNLPDAHRLLFPRALWVTWPVVSRRWCTGTWRGRTCRRSRQKVRRCVPLSLCLSEIWLDLFPQKMNQSKTFNSSAFTPPPKISFPSSAPPLQSKIRSVK